MGKLMNIITPLHKATARKYIERMQDEKVQCMKIAKKWDFNFWDGDRRYGYGGMRYDGRWAPVAQTLIDTYGLTNESSILDIGCGKAFLLYEIKKILPGAKVAGIDISEYAIENAKEEIRENLFVHRAQDPLPFGDKQFDLIISLTTLHNLQIFDLKRSLQEIERVGKNKYVVVEGYRNEEELFNLECWALTCESFFTPQEWIWLYGEFGYAGDYEFIYF